jgi:hypothetical protein
MWRRVDLLWTDVSEERIASIFSVEKFGSDEPEWADNRTYMVYVSQIVRYALKTFRHDTHLQSVLKHLRG